MGDLGGLTFEFNHLATLAIMLVCPVCDCSHKEEVSNCQRCNWSMQQDDLGISSEHEILTICIPNLTKRLEDAERDKNALLSHIQILDPDLQKKNNHKLDEIQEEIKKQGEQISKQFKNDIEEIINKLNSLSKVKEKISAIQNISSSVIEDYSSEPNYTTEHNTKIENNDIELLTQSSFELNSPVSLPGFLKDNNYDNSFTEKSDRHLNNDFNPTNEPQEGSLYNETGDRHFTEITNSQEDTKTEVNSISNYQSFYYMIRNRELEVNKVTVPQETMEKIRGGTHSEFKFVNEPKGNYWIVNWHDVYCLIPKEKINIEEHNYGHFQRIFDCQNYKETYSNFEVVEPATVFNSNNGTWQLERKGKIKFI